MGEAIAGIMGQSDLLGRNTYRCSAGLVHPDAEDDPGAPFMNDTPKYIISSTLGRAD